MTRTVPKWLWIVSIFGISTAFAQPWLKGLLGISAMTTFLFGFVVTVVWIAIDLFVSNSAK